MLPSSARAARMRAAVAVSLALGLALIAAGALSSRAADDAAPVPPVFEKDIAPLLKAYCWKCHGGEGRQAGLDLRTLPLALHGGRSGPALARGSSRESQLIQKIRAGEMPPKGEAQPTEQHKELIARWIDAGARAAYEGGPLTEEESPPTSEADRAAWAYRTPDRAPIPDVSDPARADTPIDRFLLARLANAGLSFSPQADRRALVRRASFDLIGLPPTPDEVEQFVADDAPGAWERLIDRLLASPHYGERWGRHWLDACGYVDSLGTDNDATIIEPHEGIWKYRDYVVAAFNADKPYDRFLLEQIAGDELVDWRNAGAYDPATLELLTATGFLRQAADVTYAPELNTADIRHQVVFDTVQIVSTNLLGLTVHCAQCHTHKFDPITQADYYRIAGIFAPSYNVQNWTHSKDRLLPDVPAARKKEIDEHNAKVDRELAEISKEIDALRNLARPKLLETKLAALAPADREAARAALALPTEQRTAEQKSVVEKFAPMLELKPAELDAAMDDETKGTRDDLARRAAALQKTKLSHGTIQALWDVGAPPPNYLFRRGDYKAPGALVEPGVIAVLNDPAHPFQLPEPKPGAPTTGYRTAWARWLTRPDHPLTARVFVNRVWQHYFGTGIVATPDNFGLMGSAPSHPELLDWLANDFVRGGWSLKRLHRQILCSAAYRQSSRPAAHDDARTAGSDAHPDPDNRLLWKMPLRRLESEIVRDAVLAASGELTATLGGPPVPVKPNADGSVELDLEKLPRPADAGRRSLYVFARRNYQLTELGVFDQPVVATNCLARNSSAVVSQSLVLLNGKFLFEQSERFAARLRQLAGDDEAKQVELAFRLALGRPPSDDEAQLTRDLLARQRERHRAAGEEKTDPPQAALANFCQMLLNTNEFLYVP